MFLNFRETVFKLQEDLTAAAYVAKRGNPDLFTMTDWLNISCKYIGPENIIQN